MTAHEFEKLATNILETLPENFREKMENVGIVVEELPPGGNKQKNSILLGLYQGIPLKDRGIYYGGALPDKITLYKRNIEAVSRDEKEIEMTIRQTIIHEIGHHFGMSEAEIRKAGY